MKETKETMEAFWLSKLIANSVRKAQWTISKLETFRRNHMSDKLKILQERIVTESVREEDQQTAEKKED